MLFAQGFIDSSKEPKKQVNIIYILADDLGYGDLSSYGQTKFETPHIDKLAKNGLKFTQHYSGSTVCAPSRSSLLTGLHTGHTMIRGNYEVRPEGQYPLADSILTLPEVLKAKGYTTGVFGKWGLGYPGSEGDPNNQGVDEFYGYNCQRLAHHYYPRYLWQDDRKHILEGNQGMEKGQYAPDLIHNRALEFIRNNHDNPFFLLYASPLPHAELAANESDINKFRGKFPEIKPYVGYDEGENYREGPYESQKLPRTTFAAMVHTLDQQVGEIMEELKKLGLDENTLVIFTSDNGPHREGGGDPEYFDSNGPLRGFKRDLYEGGIRVPMIAHWPNKIKPGVSDHISAFWDVLPTINDLIGGDKIKGLDGISFLPTLMGSSKAQLKHDYLYWEFHEKGGRQAVRKGDWKAVKYNVLIDTMAMLELYNLSSDISEQNNLADENPEKLKEMQAILKNARTESKVFTFSSSTYLNN
jgi:arylsulfatase A